jgi:hypothetical protein
MRVVWFAMIVICASSAHAETAFAPGQWQITTQFESVFDDAQPRVEQPGNVMSRPARQIVCLSPEQAQSGALGLLGGAPQDCQYRHLSARNGKMRADMICSTGKGSPVSVRMSGSFTRDRYDLETNMSRIALGRRVRTTGQHIGAC